MRGHGRGHAGLVWADFLQSMGQETKLVRKLPGGVAAGVDSGDVGEVAHLEMWWVLRAFGRRRRLRDETKTKTDKTKTNGWCSLL